MMPKSKSTDDTASFHTASEEINPRASSEEPLLQQPAFMRQSARRKQEQATSAFTFDMPAPKSIRKTHSESPPKKAPKIKSKYQLDEEELFEDEDGDDDDDDEREDWLSEIYPHPERPGGYPPRHGPVVWPDINDPQFDEPIPGLDAPLMPGDLELKPWWQKRKKQPEAQAEQQRQQQQEEEDEDEDEDYTDEDDLVLDEETPDMELLLDSADEREHKKRKLARRKRKAAKAALDPENYRPTRREINARKELIEYYKSFFPHHGMKFDEM